MNIYCVKGVAAYHELRAVCATVPDGTPSGTVAHTARMHTRIHDMLPHPSHNIYSCFTTCFTSDFS
jgi:hypothetical protein